MMALKKIAALSNDAATLLQNLRSQDYAKEVAKGKFGFKAYDRLAKLRAFAITHPALYLAAKNARIMGGITSPQAADFPGGEEMIKLLYGVDPNTGVIGVAGEVADIYASTIAELYDAGSDEKTADQYASAVAQALLTSKMSVIEAEFPEPFTDTSERNLVMNQLGTVGGRIAMGAPKLKSTALVRK